MKRFVAVFLTTIGSNQVIGAYEHYEESERLEKTDKTLEEVGYTRLTQWVEVDFPELEKVDMVGAEIKYLDKQLKEAEEKLDEVKTRVERRKSELLAITYQE